MTAFRFFVILVIFGAATAAWAVLGSTLEYRTADLNQSLGKEVDNDWGPSGLVQEPPTILPPADGDGKPGGAGGVPVRSDIRVTFDHADRYKGLLWFSTYSVQFSGTYTVPSPAAAGGEFLFHLPENGPVPENLRVTVGDAPLEVDPAATAVVVPVPTGGGEVAITVAYQMRGRDRWAYGPAPGTERPVRLRDFSLTATTNFTDIDYPKGAVSPSTPAAPADGGMTAVWKFDDYATRQQIGIEMPFRRNAGPIAARMAFYAPVSLFFFFTVMFMIVILKRIPLHPMHYLFVSAGFFAFHILLAYLVDKIGIHEAFWICAATSVLLVVSYMRLVAGARFAILHVGLAQLVYLVGFSYAFFWVGWTGLTIVIVAILTLFILMQATGRLDWNQVFRSSGPSSPAGGGTPWQPVPPAPAGEAPPKPPTA
jgi:hypothetical protein